MVAILLSSYFASETRVHPLLFVSVDLVALVDVVSSADMLCQLVMFRNQMVVIVLGEQIELACPGSEVVSVPSCVNAQEEQCPSWTHQSLGNMK